jgi:hypothetical protein
MSTPARKYVIKPLVVCALAAGALAPANAYALQSGSAPQGAARPASAVVVAPGQRLAIGHGQWLTLTATQVCDGGAQTAENCSSVTNGNQGPDTVSLLTSGDTTGTLYRALYLGSGAARITVQAGQQTYQLRLVRLAGDPGYTVGYAWGAPQTTATVGATVYNAAGTVLATL